MVVRLITCRENSAGRRSAVDDYAVRICELNARTQIAVDDTGVFNAEGVEPVTPFGDVAYRQTENGELLEGGHSIAIQVKPNDDAALVLQRDADDPILLLDDDHRLEAEDLQVPVPAPQRRPMTAVARDGSR